MLLLGHPVYSLTVTLFSLLLGTGLGAAWSRRFDDATLRRTGALARSCRSRLLGARRDRRRDADRRRGRFRSRASVRMLIAVALLVPIGVVLASRCRPASACCSARAPQMVAWAWGINGALSVLGATLAIFIAMNWGFQVTLLAASATYLLGLVALLAATR